MKQDETPNDLNASKSPRWFGKKKPPESNQKLIFSFSREADPDFEDDVDVTRSNSTNHAESSRKVSHTNPNGFSEKKRTASEHSMASIPDMVVTEIEAPNSASEVAGSSIIDSGHRLLQVKSNADRQDSTSMRSFRSVTNTIISSGKEREEEKLAKKRALELAKVEKEAKLAAEKAAKEAKKKPAAAAVVAEEEEPDVVKKIEFEGKKYLKSKKTGVVYDYTEYVKNGEQVVIGKWNDNSNKIDFNKTSDEEEEEEYSM